MTVPVAPVSTFFTPTIAPPTAAPEASSTFPDMVAVTWAHAKSRPAVRITIANNSLLKLGLVIAAEYISENCPPNLGGQHLIFLFMETQFSNSVSLAFVEALYVDYLRDPESVPPDWRH